MPPKRHGRSCTRRAPALSRQDPAPASHRQVVVIFAEECHTGGNLHRQWPPGLGDADVGLDEPAVVAEVHQFVIIILSEGRGYLNACPDN